MARYFGEKNSLGKPHGKGVCKWLDGSSYEGSFKDGILEGVGLYTWNTGNQYYGQFKDGQRTGYGIFVWGTSPKQPNSEENDNNNNNNNAVHKQSGDVYEGNFLNGKLQGEGTYWYSNGDKYNGNWNGGDMDGKGTLYVSSQQSIFNCYWKSGEAREGTWLSKEGHIYTGSFHQGKPHGKGGVYTWPSGKTKTADFHYQRGIDKSTSKLLSDNIFQPSKKSSDGSGGGGGGDLDPLKVHRMILFDPSFLTSKPTPLPPLNTISISASSSTIVSSSVKMLAKKLHVVASRQAIPLPPVPVLQTYVQSHLTNNTVNIVNNTTQNNNNNNIDKTTTKPDSKEHVHSKIVDNNNTHPHHQSNRKKQHKNACNTAIDKNEHNNNNNNNNTNNTNDKANDNSEKSGVISTHFLTKRDTKNEDHDDISLLHQQPQPQPQTQQSQSQSLKKPLIVSNSANPTHPQERTDHDHDHDDDIKGSTPHLPQQEELADKKNEFILNNYDNNKRIGTKEDDHNDAQDSIHQRTNGKDSLVSMDNADGDNNGIDGAVEMLFNQINDEVTHFCELERSCDSFKRIDDLIFLEILSTNEESKPNKTINNDNDNDNSNNSSNNSNNNLTETTPGEEKSSSLSSLQNSWMFLSPRRKKLQKNKKVKPIENRNHCSHTEIHHHPSEHHNNNSREASLINDDDSVYDNIVSDLTRIHCFLSGTTNIENNERVIRLLNEVAEGILTLLGDKLNPG
eukprot:TRINITY_DN1068_c0_g1_i1.p1 TRINITY_DN1068_c0_g1~~TRINITY_DN1068_c0_g1_i1.p1  ORF type:complete len:733 (-),score=221.83 TRINITY_DN1068_c0_g1_i1:201-2399(-)